MIRIFTFICLVCFSLQALSLEKMNQGDWSILATELGEQRTLAIYLLPFNDLDSSSFKLDFAFYQESKRSRFSINKDLLISQKTILVKSTVEDISGSAFTIDGPFLRIVYDLKEMPELWDLLTHERKGHIKFTHLTDPGIYLERYFYRFQNASALISLPLPTLNELNSLSNKTLKLPISMVLTGSSFNIYDPFHIDVFLKNLKKEVDSYWKDQCNIELEYKSIRAFNPVDRGSFSFVADLNPEYFIMESWFHTKEKSIPVVSGKSAIGAAGVAMMKDAWVIRNVKEMMSKVKNPDMVLFSHEGADRTDANTLAHELGHILLQEGHSTDSRNLMSAGGMGTKELPRKITKSQCKKAREYLEATFK
jgi:hypothetical protein